MKNYQELWINGPVNVEHQRGCESRYQAIKKVADRFNRPFSVFDFGGNTGYFSLRLSQDYDAFCAMIDNKNAADIIAQNEPSKIVAMQGHIGPDIIEPLARSEHFDIVLVLSVLHHVADWKRALNAFLDMGNVVLIEIPGGNEPEAVNASRHEEIYKAVSELAIGEIHTEDSHLGKPRTIFELKGNSIITNQTVDASVRGSPPVKVDIEADYDKASIYIQHGGASPSLESRELIPGMNLWNWRILNGKYPRSINDGIDEAINSLPLGHDDLQPWNFLIDGEKIIPIDYDNKSFRQGSFDASRMKEILA
jgi:SAM-dependent methyltransferase